MDEGGHEGAGEDEGVGEDAGERVGENKGVGKGGDADADEGVGADADADENGATELAVNHKVVGQPQHLTGRHWFAANVPAEP